MEDLLAELSTDKITKYLELQCSPKQLFSTVTKFYLPLGEMLSFIWPYLILFNFEPISKLNKEDVEVNTIQTHRWQTNFLQKSSFKPWAVVNLNHTLVIVFVGIAYNYHEYLRNSMPIVWYNQIKPLHPLTLWYFMAIGLKHFTTWDFLSCNILYKQVFYEK